MTKGKRGLLWPLIILTVVGWTVLGGVIWWVDPAIVRDFPWANSYLLFFLVFFLAWFFGLTLILRQTRRGFLYALGITLFLVLRLIRLGNVVNAALLMGLVMVIDFYFSNR